MRVVFDTNIFVSAFVLPGSNADVARMRVVNGPDRLIISKPIIDGLLGVLAGKFSRNANELAHVAVFLSDLAETVRPRQRVAVLKDEADNRILECARAGSADAIVTGDKAMLAIARFEATRIISLRQYLESG